ncbi:MAG: hypothetical protein MZV63_25440 [Marinilabiliales bacterium]|nr:hypothetical protein [Marinilabiliales bacterium]
MPMITGAYIKLILLFYSFSKYQGADPDHGAALFYCHYSSRLTSPIDRWVKRIVTEASYAGL